MLLTCLLGWCFGVLLAPPAAAGVGVSTERWVWPLEPRPSVVAGFDPPPKPWLAGHRGVDLAGSAGQRVLSAGYGEVTFAGRLAGIGIVVVRSGELRTTYQPVRATVHVGELVGAGHTIGRLEKFGSHCLPEACLHWGLLRGRTYLDPLTLVGAGPPRLLPLHDGAGAGGTAASPLIGPATSTSQPTISSQPAGSERRVLAGAAVVVAAGVLGGSLALSRRSPTARPKWQVRLR